MSTAINYVDGLDGLAAGIVGIGAAALLLYCERLDSLGAIGPDNAGPVVAAAVPGACLGFLPHNLHPATHFLGNDRAALARPVLSTAPTPGGGHPRTHVHHHTFPF